MFNPADFPPGMPAPKEAHDGPMAEVKFLKKYRCWPAGKVQSFEAPFAADLIKGKIAVATAPAK